jgi:hypothetical protein
MDSGTFISKLPKIYWSKNSPKTYTIFRDGLMRGVGLVAEQDYGAWNLVYDKYDWNLWTGHEYGVLAWSATSQALKYEYGGATLSDTVVALGSEKWPIWWKANRKEVPPQFRQRIDAVSAKIASLSPSERK